LGKMSREKGKRGERLLAKVLREFGYETRRGVQYQGGADSADVVGLEYIHIECKFVEKLNLHAAYMQAVEDAGASGNIPAVFHRRNRGDWMVTMSLDDWMKLYNEFFANRKLDEMGVK